MDYRSLLVRYIAHVVDMEGADFIYPHLEGYARHIPFTQDELDELRKLSTESNTFARKA